MSNKIRWRYGDTNPVVAAVGSSTVIEIGDLLWQDVDNAKPAGELGEATRRWPSEQQQGAFAERFLGVAMQRSRAGDTDPIRVAITGVFEFDVVKAIDCELGDLLGVCCTDGVGQSVQPRNQQVEKVAASGYAVGRCAKRGTSLSTVMVDIRSTVMTGGVEDTSADGV